MAALDQRTEKLSAFRHAWLEANKPTSSPGSLLKINSRNCPWQKQSEADWKLQRLTYDYVKGHQLLGSNPHVEIKPNTTWRDYAAAAASNSTREALSHLQNLAANGDPRALKAYATLTCDMVESLNDWALNQHSEKLKAVARKFLAWPMRISTRKAFGDDPDLVAKLQVAKETIAADRAARFNPKKKYGMLVLYLLERIDARRSENCPYLFEETGWANSAHTLPAFSLKASRTDQQKWLAVVDELLQEDLGKATLAFSYREFITADSHADRWQAVLRDKVKCEFDSLWGIHRKPKM